MLRDLRCRQTTWFTRQIDKFRQSPLTWLLSVGSVLSSYIVGLMTLTFWWPCERASERRLMWRDVRSHRASSAASGVRRHKLWVVQEGEETDRNAPLSFGHCQRFPAAHQHLTCAVVHPIAETLYCALWLSLYTTGQILVLFIFPLRNGSRPTERRNSRCKWTNRPLMKLLRTSTVKCNLLVNPLTPTVAIWVQL